MGETIDRAVYEIETRRTGDRRAITGVRDEMLSTQQVQRAAQDFDRRYTSQAAEGQRRIIQAERERRQGVAEDLRLLSLRVQTVNAGNTAEIAALRESLAAQREYQQGSKASQQENLRLVQITQQLERRVDAVSAAQLRANNTTRQFPIERIRAGGNAVAALAFAAENATLGGRSAVTAFGNLATTLALVSQNAKFASWAGWIGAAVTVAASLAAILSRVGAEERDRDERRFRRQLGDADVHTAERLLEVLREQKREVESIRPATAAGRLTERIDNWLEGLLGVGRGQELAQIRSRIKEVEIEREALIERHARAEATRRRENTESLNLRIREAETTRDLLTHTASLSEFEQERNRLEADTVQRMEAISREYLQQRDAAGHLLPLTDEQKSKLADLLGIEVELSRLRREEIAEREKIAQANATIAFLRERGGAADVFTARMAEIEIQREAETRLYGDVALVAERAEFRKRQLYRETAKEAGKAFEQIHDAFINSSSRDLKAIAHIADSVRRLQIGAEAALAAVESARQFAKVPGALAAGNPVAAALHALSGTQLAAAAALGFREALGSGGGGGAAGGGGVGAGTTFEPDRATEGGGATTVNLWTIDPDSPSRIARTTWLINRNRVLGRQMFIPPTTGFHGGQAA
jgi:hypothetical protein